MARARLTRGPSARRALARVRLSAPPFAASAWLPALVTAAVALTVMVGLLVTLLAPPRAFGSWLGAPLAPFFGFWRPEVSAWTAVSALALFGAAAVAGRLRSPALSPVAFAVATLALALGLRLALAASADGPEAWPAPFQGTRGANEYLPALSALELGPRVFLDRFAEIAPTLPLHPSAHPPGMLLVLNALGIDSAGAMAALTIVTGAGAAPLTYVLGRRLLDEGGARVAALLFAFAPSALIYGATSADALFATLGVATAALLIARGRLPRALGALALALSSFFSWALLAIGAWAALLTASAAPAPRARRSAPIWGSSAAAFGGGGRSGIGGGGRSGIGGHSQLEGTPAGFAAAVRLAMACAAALAAFYGGLYALFGFDLLRTLAAADDAYRAGIYFGRPYWYWLFGSPAAFLVAMGLPVAWLALRALAARRRPALALAGVVVTAAVLGFSKAETERIWLFMVPLACVAAAGELSLSERRLAAVLGLLAAQALAVEVLLGTIW